MSRPTKWKPEFANTARLAAKLGATDREIAEMLGVSERTLNNWKHEHPEFAGALLLGKDAADDRVEQSLYRRAVGYEHDAVKIAVNAQGEITQVQFTERYPPDTTAAIFWLKNRRKEEWRDVSRQEQTGADGAPLTVVIRKPE